MTEYPKLPPGAWASPEAARKWDDLLEHWETLGTIYRQGIYLSMVDPRMARRFSHPEYRAHVEKEHRRKCDALEPLLRDHFLRHYVSEDGELEFELLWLPRN